MTFLTQNMKYIVSQIIKRLSTGEGNPVIFLSTEFGGGKTHTLLLLFHLFQNRNEGFQYLKDNEIDKDLSISNLPSANLVAIDCKRLDPLKLTLWGEIGKQLNIYDLVKEYDEKRIVPNIDIIMEMVDKPVLILIDELPNYLFSGHSVIVGKKTLSELTINFIENLNAAISNTQKSQLLITLTGGQPIYSEEVGDIIKIKNNISMVNGNFYNVD